MTIEVVTDVADSRLDDYRSLPDRRLAEEGLLVAEGWFVVERLLASAFPVRSVLVASNRVARVPPFSGPVYAIEQALLDQVAGFHAHRGILAAASRLPERTVREVVPGASVVVVAEGITDAENIGGIFRNAAAFGADAVLLSPTSCDPLYRRAVRVSVGHALTVPFARVDPWPAGLASLRSAAPGIRIVALDPGADRTLAEVAGAGAPLALLVGSEGPGLSAAAASAADERARIPMATGVDSLNVATAAAVALYALTTGRDRS